MMMMKMMSFILIKSDADDESSRRKPLSTLSKFTLRIRFNSNRGDACYLYPMRLVYFIYYLSVEMFDQSNHDDL